MNPTASHSGPGTERTANGVPGGDISPGMAEDFLSGGGLMGLLIREFDWGATSLGTLEQWPQSLRTSVSICLTSQFPIVLWWGQELNMLYNDAYSTILGMKHPEALGKPAWECWHEIWDVIGPMLTGVLETGEATFSDDLLLMLERAGYPEECYFTFSYSPIRDESGGVGGIFCPVKESTEKVLNDRRLRTLRELGDRGTKARTVEEACHAILQTLSRNPRDLPFTCLYLCNEEPDVARLAGASGIDTGTDASPERVFLRKGTTGDAWHPVLSEAIASKQLVCFSGNLFGSLSKGGWDTRPESVTVLPLEFAGESERYGALVTGINPHKRIDQEYTRFLDLVACQVGDNIAAALAYEAAQKRAEALAALDRAKTAFFSNISHEFRTPLTLMLGPLEDTLADASDGLRLQTRESLETVHRNALRLLKLVNTLLDFSRIEAGRVQAHYEAVDLAQFTSELAGVFRSAVEKAGMYLNVECPPLADPVYVNRDMWEKIVLNLLSNAFKFTLDGGIAVSMAEDASRVWLAVKDTGIGIDEQEQPRIFERFHRVTGSRGRSFEGSGIGLALVQELVKQHGGTVTVRSSPGKGSEFTVSLLKGSAHLPRERMGGERRQRSSVSRAGSYAQEALSWLSPTASEQITDLARPSAEDHDQQPVMDIAPASVLLVEDNSDMREYLRSLLGSHHQVTVARDGVDALSKIRAAQPELVLTDVMMPQMDGFELLREIRSNPETSGLPVIILSARAGEESRVEGLERGADDYVVKPFTARELLARVNAVIAMSRLRREASRKEAELRAEIERQQEILHAALRASETGTFSWSQATGEYTHFDNNLKQLFGIPKEEVVTQTEQLMSRVHPDDREELLKKLEHSRQGADFEAEYRVVLSDGSVRWLLDRAKLGVENGIPYLVGACTNITEKKLAQAALIQSEKLASIGRMAATVAHEINNPLEAATNLLYLASSAATASPQLKSYLSDAEEQLGRVADLTRQTLGFYRDQSQPVAMQVGPILRQIQRVFAQKTKNRNIEVALEIGSDPEFVANPGEIRQVFINLLGNAIEAVGPGGKVRVRVSAGRECVRVAIVDSGPGIPAAIRKNIFEPFFTTKKDLGTGLGLWVAKNIVEKHGGRIRLRSSQRSGSNGTTVSVLLPLAGEA